jgi:GH25 family lysozyme M1 (1,4-beta-N-acetylmuramidase)
VGGGTPSGRGGRAEAAAIAGGYSILGIDVSSNDHSRFPIDWGAQAASGLKFAYVKATEASSYTNPYFHDDNAGAKAAGLLTGAYTFGRPDLRNAAGDANYFIDHAEWTNDSRTLVPFLDLEWPYAALHQPDSCYGLSPADLVTWIHTFVEQVRARTGRTMAIYTNPHWWNPCTGNSTEFGANPLDVASWTADPPTTLPSGWSAFTIWQYAAGDNSTPGNFDKDAFNGDYAALTRLAGGNPAVGAPLALRAHANDRFVTAEKGGTQPLIANRTAIGTWEEFDQVDAGGGYYALRAHANGRYVSAENAGNSPLIANRTDIGDWERFTIATNSDGSISLKAKANGRYVSADNAGAWPLIANRTVRGTWEEFDKVDAPTVISLYAAVNSKYVTAEKGGTQPLIANRTTIGSWEQYDEVDAGGGYHALRAHANGRYVSAENAGSSPLIATGTEIGDPEKFTITTNSDGTISLKAKANGRYVSADSAGSAPLIADRTSIGGWEEFYLVQ